MGGIVPGLGTGTYGIVKNLTDHHLVRWIFNFLVIPRGALERSTYRLGYVWYNWWYLDPCGKDLILDIFIFNFFFYILKLNYLLILHSDAY